MTAHIKKRAIYALLDDRCDGSQKQKILRHFDECPACREQFNRTRSLQESMKRMYEPTPDWTHLDHQITRLITETVSQRRAPLSLRQVLMIGALALLFVASGVLAYSFIADYIDDYAQVETTESRNSTFPPASSKQAPKTQEQTTPFSDAGSGAPSGEMAETYRKNSETLDIQNIVTKSDAKVVVRGPTEKMVRKWPGTLPMRAIRSTLAGTRQNIRQCYERALKRTPRLTATFDIVITIDQSGQVSSATIKNGDIGQSLVGCIEKQLISLQFPPPKGGAMRLVMPIRLYPSSY